MYRDIAVAAASSAITTAIAFNVYKRKIIEARVRNWRTTNNIIKEMEVGFRAIFEAQQNIIERYYDGTYDESTTDEQMLQDYRFDTIAYRLEHGK